MTARQELVSSNTDSTSILRSVPSLFLNPFYNHHCFTMSDILKLQYILLTSPPSPDH